jgi:NADPH-dependent 2,4-dienoyl-CoA reductase/sulfur reductase-like enzyme
VTDTERIPEPGKRASPRSDVVVVGGGPAGFAAAVAARRNGASVTLLERYPYLGGLASGGMVIVLDDMCNGPEVTVKGICQEVIDRRARPAPIRRRRNAPAIRRLSQVVALGRVRFHTH